VRGKREDSEIESGKVAHLNSGLGGNYQHINASLAIALAHTWLQKKNSAEVPVAGIFLSFSGTREIFWSTRFLLAYFVSR
jgi:hypothetical protein